MSTKELTRPGPVKAGLHGDIGNVEGAAGLKPIMVVRRLLKGMGPDPTNAG